VKNSSAFGTDEFGGQRLVKEYLLQWEKDRIGTKKN
jgi:hypothetical protein